jgi:hypothetical protein
VEGTLRRVHPERDLCGVRQATARPEEQEPVPSMPGRSQRRDAAGR